MSVVLWSGQGCSLHASYYDARKRWGSGSWPFYTDISFTYSNPSAQPAKSSLYVELHAGVLGFCEGLSAARRTLEDDLPM